MAESELGKALSCPQGLGLNGPIGPFKPSDPNTDLIVGKEKAEIVYC